jgi:hypothetical protein
MQYQISRNGQLYGPYTLEDLQRYIASGNVLLSDLAKSEDMADWVPVAQILAGATSSTPPPAAEVQSAPVSQPYAGPDFGGSVYNPQAQAANSLATSPYPDAPNLHWGLVLLFAFLTCTLFMYIWNLVVTGWLKRVQPNSTALFFYIGAVVLIVIRSVVGLGHAVSYAVNDNMRMAGGATGIGLGLVIWIVRLIARYSEMAQLEEHFNTVEPVGLQLNGVMVFFFGGVYFQYKLNEINAMKQAARFGAARPY